MKKLILSLIKAYQKSSFLRKPVFKTLFLTDAACRFTPTCAHYSHKAINKYGVVKGGWLSLKRIARCHPFSPGGIDPIPKNF